jgi:hypothetical protein
VSLPLLPTGPMKNSGLAFWRSEFKRRHWYFVLFILYAYLIVNVINRRFFSFVRICNCLGEKLNFNKGFYSLLLLHSIRLYICDIYYLRRDRVRLILGLTSLTIDYQLYSVYHTMPGKLLPSKLLRSVGKLLPHRVLSQACHLQARSPRKLLPFNKNKNQLNILSKQLGKLVLPP